MPPETHHWHPSANSKGQKNCTAANTARKAAVRRMEPGMTAHPLSSFPIP